MSYISLAQRVSTSFFVAIVVIVSVETKKCCNTDATKYSQLTDATKSSQLATSVGRQLDSTYKACLASYHRTWLGSLYPQVPL